MKTLDEIYSELCEEYVSQSGLQLTDGGDMAIRLYATAVQLYSLWVHEQYVARQMFPQTADGEYLDLHAELRDLERTAATYAEGTIRFQVDEARQVALEIAKGVCCTTDAGVEYLTTQASVIAIGNEYCDIPAAAKDAGKSGNTPANSIVNMTLAPTGVSCCTNPAAFTGGSDSEEDESLRARIVASYKRLPNGANSAYYESHVLNTDGVAAVEVVPRSRGIGTVDVIVASEDGVPTSELLASIAAELEEQREICVSIQVLAPTTLPVSIAADITPGEGYSYVQAAANVQERIADYFSGELLGKPIRIAKLSDIVFNSKGVENCKITSPASDLVANVGVLPVLGGLTLSELV